MVWKEKGKGQMGGRARCFSVSGQDEGEGQVIPPPDQLWTALALQMLPHSKANPGPLPVRT